MRYFESGLRDDERPVSVVAIEQSFGLVAHAVLLRRRIKVFEERKREVSSPVRHLLNQGAKFGSEETRHQLHEKAMSRYMKGAGDIMNARFKIMPIEGPAVHPHAFFPRKDVAMSGGFVAAMSLSTVTHVGTSEKRYRALSVVCFTVYVLPVFCSSSTSPAAE